MSAAAICPADAGRADTGPSATQAAPRGARSSCVWRLQGYPENGPTPQPTSMAICSISSVCTPVEHRYGTPWRRPSRSSHCGSPLPQMAAIAPAAMTVRKQRAASGGVAGPSMAPMRKPICTPAPSAIAASRALRFHPDLIYRGDDGIHRMPALVAAVTGDDGAVEGVQRTWLDPKRPEKANLARPRKALGRVHGRAVRFGGSASGATLLAGEGIETVLSLVTAVPGIHAAAALIGGQPGRLRTAPRSRPVGHRPR